ncbi:hypothetical protein RHMOL_Rhmol11G0030200 [Rhododendron molle]|uniref:Uncharacterized protein n=1 Tax=Rhododendron molle TaxID=49168 RepID=A0ACC0LNB6_RHOML|nr:hypothetical protein RHMOL_Rhmol11G0030200 [Rhododendron molle]
MKVEKVVKICRAVFVVDISELGENDSLMQNVRTPSDFTLKIKLATQSFESLKVPWYTTTALDRQGSDYFLKPMKTTSMQCFLAVVLCNLTLHLCQLCIRIRICGKCLPYFDVDDNCSNQTLISHRSMVFVVNALASLKSRPPANVLKLTSRQLMNVSRLLPDKICPALNFSQCKASE